MFSLLEVRSVATPYSYSLIYIVYMHMHFLSFCMGCTHKLLLDIHSTGTHPLEVSGYAPL